MELTPALMAKYNEHVGTHVDRYPADCNDLVTACNNLSEFTHDEKEWFSKNLPHGTFENAHEVRKALRL